MHYSPVPIDTTTIQLPASLIALVEQLAENTHDVWALQRLSTGWTWGPTRDDAHKKHPCLVPYADLPEQEKEYDRKTVLETIKATVKLGYRVTPAGS